MDESALVDLSGVTLAQLADLPDSVLAHALQQVLSDEGGSDRIAAFNAAL